MIKQNHIQRNEKVNTYYMLGVKHSGVAIITGLELVHQLMKMITVAARRMLQIHLDLAGYQLESKLFVVVVVVFSISYKYACSARFKNPLDFVLDPKRDGIPLSR